MRTLNIREDQRNSSKTPINAAIHDHNGNSRQEAAQAAVHLVIGEVKVVDHGEEDHNPKTPRSVEHRIPVTVTCPPAPRKQQAKWGRGVPTTTGKRRRIRAPSSCFPAGFKIYLDDAIMMPAFNQTVVYVPDHIVVGHLRAMSTPPHTNDA
ncbi:hypothetical protein SSX86_032781 [Deinandra increscens subsp. villosa]|uniref:Uncharacterized protein n=1 Tax=Deinandra increscens subsp. villosa TaxID=3103831 RepID=A0AAP0C6F3_9ASTR